MAPTVFRKDGYRFFFFSREESRMHVHVLSGDGEAKFWPEPRIELARNFRFKQVQLNTIESIVEEYHHELVAAWKKHFEG